MKRLLKYLLLLPLITGAFVFSSNLSKKNQAFETRADQVSPTPRSGESGKILFVNGANTYFKKDEANLAIYCFNNSSDNAWSDASSYRIGDTMRVMIPYKDGASRQWSKLIICRYNPSKNPKNDGWDGVYNKTVDLNFSDLMYSQNTFTVNGYGSDNYITVASLKSVTTYNGIKCDNHAYLDLSGFQGWEDGNAKFALFFGAPDYFDASEWGKSNSSGGNYSSSFMWQVKGQDNPHLYECIVPSYGNGDRIWNLVIAVRFNPATEFPYWTDDSSVIWNKTGDLQFNGSNHNANMVHINDWNGGYIDGDNIIARSSRVGFYGQYFLDTVSCSGHGNSDSTTSIQWNAVKAEYNHLSKTFQGDVWTTVADKSASASTIAQAMARYDYIVLYKKYDHEDFINRAASPNKTEYPASEMYAGLQPYASDKNSSIYIVVIALASITTLALLVVIKRKKVQNR